MLILVVASLIYAVGAYFGGRIIPRFGRKPVTVVTAFLTGLFVSIFMFQTTLGLMVGFVYLGSLFYGMWQSAASNHTLEQVPQFRGSMMSLNAATMALGTAIGSSIGGLALLWIGYEGVGLTLGALLLVAALFYHFITVDPTNEPHMRE
jgi:predicted MFS family arabinose efflux permease